MNSAKAKGTWAETAVVKYLRERGAAGAERRALHGGKDKGDITGLVGVVIEVKNEKTINLAGWLGEALAEKENAGAELGMVWAKRRGTTDPGKWYVIVDGEQAVDLLIAAGYVPPVLASAR